MDETEEGPLSERSWSVARTTENTVLRPRCTFTVPMSLPSVSVVRPSLGAMEVLFESHQRTALRVGKNLGHCTIVKPLKHPIQDERCG